VWLELGAPRGECRITEKRPTFRVTPNVRRAGIMVMGTLLIVTIGVASVASAIVEEGAAMFPLELFFCHLG
jgi:hypothetical protein